jgi:DNA-binding IclR family transcriptional regulator
MFITHCRRCGRSHPAHQACTPTASGAVWLSAAPEEQRIADVAEQVAVARYRSVRRAG